MVTHHGCCRWNLLRRIEAAYLWNGETFISFESPEAIRRKCEYVKEKGMLGVMYWEHSANHTRELLTVIAKTLNI